MNIKKYSILAVVSAVTVAALGYGIGYGTGNAKNDAKTETVENTQHSGVLAAENIGFADVIDDVDSDSTFLRENTGILNYNSIGFAGDIENYNQFIYETEGVTEEDVKLLIEQLDVATKLVPKDSVITGYVNLGVSNAHEYLNIRKGPSTDDKIIGKMPGYCACEILEEVDGWYKIKSGSVEGYVYAPLMVTGYDANVLAMENMEEKLYVTTDRLNVRDEPNTQCKVNTLVSNGELLEILEDEQNGWYKININGLIGYVSADYVEKRNILPTAVEVKEVVVTAPAAPDVTTADPAQLSDAVSQTAVDLINYAMKFLGNPYRAGGNSLTTGTDCSGFVKLIFAEFGYNLPRSSGDYINVGTKVPLNKIKPGDLILYKYGSSIGHVAIYIGNGQIIHASTPSTGIVIGNAYFTTPYCAVRVIP